MGCRAMVSPSRGQPPRIPPNPPPLVGEGSSPLYNISLDELLNNVIATEQPDHEQQNHHHATSSSSASSSTNNAAHSFPGNHVLTHTLSLSPDGVWREVVVDDDDHHQKPHGETTTTLEEFLVRAGAMDLRTEGSTADGYMTARIADPVVQQQAELLQYQLAAAAAQQPPRQQQMTTTVFGPGIPVFGNAVVRGGYTGNHHQRGASIMPMVPLAMARPTLLDSQAAAGVPEAKWSDETLDKSIERRQKRMIKNRESAARSRARKQAHINDLQGKAARLREANKYLMKQKWPHNLSLGRGFCWLL